MFRFLVFLILIFISFKAFSNDNLLTIQQQLERLQREVSDLSQSVFSNKSVSEKNTDSDLVTNLSAIDMRIYDLEKDVKTITANLEEILFQFEDLVIKIDEYEKIILSLEEKLIKVNEIKNNNVSKELPKNNEISNNNDSNTLGSLKITSDDVSTEDVKTEEANSKKTEKTQISPEDQFQTAFDNIRKKNWEQAKNSLSKFILDYPDNQLSGSAHYWLGELHMLEKKYRDAALIFAEGYQKYPKSIKAPDMLFKLSESLYNVDKIEESCKTLEKLIIDYPTNKFIKDTKKQIQEYECLQYNE